MQCMAMLHHAYAICRQLGCGITARQQNAQSLRTICHGSQGNCGVVVQAIRLIKRRVSAKILCQRLHLFSAHGKTEENSGGRHPAFAAHAPIQPGCAEQLLCHLPVLLACMRQRLTITRHLFTRKVILHQQNLHQFLSHFGVGLHQGTVGLRLLLNTLPTVQNVVKLHIACFGILLRSVISRAPIFLLILLPLQGVLQSTEITYTQLRKKHLIRILGSLHHGMHPLFLLRQAYRLAYSGTHP